MRLFFYFSGKSNVYCPEEVSVLSGIQGKIVRRTGKSIRIYGGRGAAVCVAYALRVCSSIVRSVFYASISAWWMYCTSLKA